MKTLSVFIDESGDTGPYDHRSPFYLVSMVFHDQSRDITPNLHRLQNAVQLAGYPNCIMHAGPLIRREKEFVELTMPERNPYWVWDDPERRERLCGIYNTLYNSTRPRVYDGHHIQFVGMNPEIRLDAHQANAVAQHLYGGNALYGHVVGAGKTYTMIAAAMESKRLGLSHKALYVVPNNIVGQFSAEFLQLYPSANVLMVTARDFEKQNRRKFCARIATGDYDGIVMAHSQFEKIPMSMEWQENFLRQQIQDISEGIAEMKWQNGERTTVKQMERVRRALRTKIQKLNDQDRKDDMLTFEELGVDLLFVDEADLFKNLMIVTKMRNVAGIGQSDAQKASDLFMKTRYLDQLTGRRGVVFATGTALCSLSGALCPAEHEGQLSTVRQCVLRALRRKADRHHQRKEILQAGWRRDINAQAALRVLQQNPPCRAMRRADGIHGSQARRGDRDGSLRAVRAATGLAQGGHHCRPLRRDDSRNPAQPCPRPRSLASRHR